MRGSRRTSRQAKLPYMGYLPDLRAGVDALAVLGEKLANYPLPRPPSRGCDEW